MQQLLAAGTRVNGSASDGRTALSIAAVLLDRAAVRLLLQHGADPNLADMHGVTPLLQSLLPHGDEAKHLEIFRPLIGSGAHVNGRALRDGRTALGSAVRRGSAGMVVLLLAGGADPNLADHAGTTPLIAARLSSSQVGAAEIVRRLAEAGADVNARDGRGQTAAAIAAASGHSEMLVLLRALGATNAQAHLARAGVDVPALLARAVATRRLAAVRLLVAGGTDATTIDARGWPLLIDAADRGDAEIVQALLGGGALVNGKTPTGVTALSAAVLKRHTGVVRLLLAAGADVHVRDPAGETPILIAAKFEGMVTVMPTGGGVAGTPGPPPGARIVFGTMSAAGVASAATIRNPEPELVALLLKAGADPNSADRAGRTPLMFAAAQGRLELVQVLLAGEADVEAKAANGKTAWQVATGEEVTRVLQEARTKR